MSEENVEVALAVADAWNRGDREAFISAWDEQAEFVPFRAQLEGKAYRGHDGLNRFLGEMANEWEDVRFEVGETQAVGDHVVCIGRFHARGRASGVEINAPLGMYSTLREGKLVYMRFFSEPADALAAAGLGGP